MRTRTMKKENHGKRYRYMLCFTLLAAFALFAACQRPEPEPEPPTPPVVDTDTLPTNKFVGTWVLCAMNNVNDEPPATCDLANGTADTLVFANDTTLIYIHGSNTKEYIYEFSDHVLVGYWPEPSTNNIKFSIRYYFRNEDQEMVLRGPFIMGVKNFCFHRISQN